MIFHRRPKKQDQEPEDSSWMSISDLMGGLTCIFLIIMSVSTYQFQKEQQILILAKNELQKPALTRESLLLKMKKYLEEKGMNVEVIAGEGILRLSENAIEFGPAKAFPEEHTLKNLGYLAKALALFLPCHSVSKPLFENTELRPDWCASMDEEITYHNQCGGTQDKTGIETVMIEGHTDSTTVRASAGYRDNLALSASRATTILRLLKVCESGLGQIYNSIGLPLIGVSGYADLRPAISEDSKNEKNRRIDVRIVMELPAIALKK